MTLPPRPETVTEVADGIRRIIAPNASPMTHWGTNTYLLGAESVVVIDPGPEDAAHFDAILSALGDAEVTHILVSHAHRDHSPLAARLARRTGAPVCAFGHAAAGRSPVMAALAESGMAGGGEGVDTGFVPDTSIGDGTVIATGAGKIEVIHTPGHMEGHLSFALGDVLFSGDHVMGWASTLISPPDGDLGAFRASCARLLARGDAVYLPGHGAPITETAERVEWLLSHRDAREAAILSALADGAAKAGVLTRRVYTDIPEAMLPMAERNLLAHLIDLAEQSVVLARPHVALDAVWELA
ncbi:MBL fold metallo-hydrolase [Ovoidimarina sediminis]|uniref:MBL fold metallo-hydrolase n=1 Tax=Ovoidimarina sediminis TaxID=3079856 RepID=UPI00290AE52D|nr:MBL fold metallo-hydrolase [Rhodophyticola sp. MJ-SS7]MDU8946122.1 MBL fold metallo-hydrolase [Rhodophyticola sp. MJ-SS7]